MWRMKQIQIYNIMDPLPQQTQDYSNLLLEHEPYFSSDQPIINFIQKQTPQKQKSTICPWNQHPYDANFSSHPIRISPPLDHPKHRIQNFLSTIRIKNRQFSRFHSKVRTKGKSPGVDNPEGQKNDFLMPLNSTLISFPKSRNQFRRLQNEQKIILQKLYRKRQKSKVIPKEILINTAMAHSTLKPAYPAKNYLQKSRSFIEETSLNRAYNPQSKIIKDISALKRKFPSSYYKKISGVFQINPSNQKLADFNHKTHSVDKSSHTIQNSSKKVNSLHDSNDIMLPVKFYKTFYSSPKFNNLGCKPQKEFSIQKIKEEAKNSHLNRKKSVQNSQIQLLGSTITKWKCQAVEKLKKCDPNKN